jgi:hypothetical protein
MMYMYETSTTPLETHRNHYVLNLETNANTDTSAKYMQVHSTYMLHVPMKYQ